MAQRVSTMEVRARIGDMLTALPCVTTSSSSSVRASPLLRLFPSNAWSRCASSPASMRSAFWRTKRRGRATSFQTIKPGPWLCRRNAKSARPDIRVRPNPNPRVRGNSAWSVPSSTPMSSSVQRFARTVRLGGFLSRCLHSMPSNSCSRLASWRKPGGFLARRSSSDTFRTCEKRCRFRDALVADIDHHLFITRFP